jgi:trans-aconitate methyltransferase
VGCGEGSLLKTLADAHPGVRAFGVEIADNALTLARRLLPQAEFAIADIGKHHLSKTFDLVVCADVIEHIADDEAALRNIAAMTATGGYAVVATLQGRMRRFEADIGHMRNYARGELEAKMARAGLIPERVIQWGFPLYSPVYRDLLEVLGNRGTMGKFGLIRKLIAHLIFAVFLLNSWRRGDYIFVRARKVADKPRE